MDCDRVRWLPWALGFVGDITSADRGLWCSQCNQVGQKRQREILSLHQPLQIPSMLCTISSSSSFASSDFQELHWNWSCIGFPKVQKNLRNNAREMAGRYGEVGPPFLWQWATGSAASATECIICNYKNKVIITTATLEVKICLHCSAQIIQ